MQPKYILNLLDVLENVFLFLHVHMYVRMYVATYPAVIVYVWSYVLEQTHAVLQCWVASDSYNIC